LLCGRIKTLRPKITELFFIINPKEKMVSSAKEFIDEWGEQAEFF
jgi:hypothetical protein